jgi:hypothetical protein
MRRGCVIPTAAINHTAHHLHFQICCYNYISISAGITGTAITVADGTTAGTVATMFIPVAAITVAAGTTASTTAAIAATTDAAHPIATHYCYCYFLLQLLLILLTNATHTTNYYTRLLLQPRLQLLPLLRHVPLDQH